MNNHSALSAQINISTLTTKAQRQEASRLIIKGRKLRAQGRDLGAEQSEPSRKATRLLKQGWANHATGMNLLDQCEGTRNERRHAHLAAALLNGRTYKQCEPTINKQKTPQPSAQCISEHLRLHLPKEMRAHAEFITEKWLQGDLRLRDLQNEGLARLIEIDSLEAGIAQAKREQKTQTKKLQLAMGARAQSQQMHARNERLLAEASDRCTEAESKIDDLKAKLEEARDPGPITSIADLLAVA